MSDVSAAVSDGCLLTYHGTTSVRAERILREGLLAGSYLAESIELARYYAGEAVEADLEADILDVGVEAVLEVRAPIAMLRYDDHAMDEPVMTGEVRRDRAWHQAAGDHPDWVVKGYVCVPADVWEISWAGAGSVRAGTIIPSAHLRCLPSW